MSNVCCGQLCCASDDRECSEGFGWNHPTLENKTLILSCVDLREFEIDKGEIVEFYEEFERKSISC